MARIKTTVNLSDVRSLIPKLEASALDISERQLKIAIVDKTIMQGISPVDGEGFFEDYSQSYKKAIKDGRYKRYRKSTSPVNMKLDGSMLKSFYVDQSGKSLITGFTHYLADIHTRQGAGRAKVIRKLLPIKKGEEFIDSIQNVILDLLAKSVDRILRK